jgi:RNA polymerase sigma-70 factor (ECF subfamily)
MSGTPIDSDTDRYIDAYRNGDHQAFECLFDIYKDRVYSVAFHFCRNRTAAEEITQIVFIKLMRKIHSFRGSSEFSSWLYRIVINTCLDYRKRKEHLVLLPEAHSEVQFFTSASQEEEIQRRQVSEIVREAIARLKPKLRLPLLLRCVADLSYEEIGRILKIPEGTVASRINRAHLQMAEVLRPFKDLIR